MKVMKRPELDMLARLRRMARDTQIRAAAEVPAAALEDFYERMLPERAAFLKRHWRWLYRVGEYGSLPSPLVATVGEQIVGHGGVMPVTVRRGGEERTAVWLLDFAILPEYQRKAVGGLLVHTGMALCPLQVAFLNERSWSMVEKLGWETRFHTLASRLFLRPGAHPALRGAAKKSVAALAGLATRVMWRARTFRRQKPSISPATSEALAIFSGAEGGAALHVPRSAEFLRWRIATHPCAEEHKVLSFRDGRGGVYSALARVVEDRGYRRLHLLTVHGDLRDRNGLSRFFASLVGWAVEEDYHHILFITSDPTVAAVARWWLPVHKPIRFACHANDPSGREFLSGTDHLWECLDSDLDLMHVTHSVED
jgi:hypothetical protein